MFVLFFKDQIIVMCRFFNDIKFDVLFSVKNILITWWRKKPCSFFETDKCIQCVRGVGFSHGL
jgi:hypothetical protein